MRLVLLFLILSLKSFAQNGTNYIYRTIKDDFKVIEINCTEKKYFTIYVESITDCILYKIVSLKKNEYTDNFTLIRLEKNKVYNMSLKSYFNIDKKIGDTYYPISSSNNIGCIGIEDNIKICIEDRENMDKDVFFVSELLGIYVVMHH